MRRIRTRASVNPDKAPTVVPQNTPVSSRHKLNWVSSHKVSLSFTAHAHTCAG